MNQIQTEEELKVNQIRIKYDSRRKEGNLNQIQIERKMNLIGWK